MAERIRCNLCAADDRELVYIHPSGRVANGVCRRCGLAYLCPRPEASETQAHYQSYEQSYPDQALLAPGNAFARTAAERAAFACRFVAPGAVVYEVGCSYGHFLHAAGGRGLEVHGIEPSVPQQTFARDKLGLRRVTPGTVEDLPGDGSADLVALFHVLEHLRDPLAALARAAQTLRPGGYLFLDLPNALVLPATAIEHYYVVSGQHLFAFTPAVMIRALARCGFEALYVANHPLAGVYPSNLRVVARKASLPRSADRDARGQRTDAAEAIAALQRYHAGLAALGRQVSADLRRWAAAGKRVALYGAGFHTLGLLDLCDFGGVDLVAILDDDERKHGRRLGGVPIQSGQMLAHGAAPRSMDAVLISSLAGEEAIAARLGHLTSCGVEVSGIYASRRRPAQDEVVYLQR